jgi:hypothetical protein
MITPYNGNDRRVYCSARRSVRSTFMQVVGIESQVVSAYAVGLQMGRQTKAALLAANYSAGLTQPINYTRLDGQRYSIIIEGNNLRLGTLPEEDDDWGNENYGNGPHADPVVVGVVATAQNTYVDSNNSIGQAVYGDTNFPNYGKGNWKTSPELLDPAAGGTAGMVFLDPNYYLDRATADGHVYHGNVTFRKNDNVSGFYFVYGDILIDKQVTGTATFAATGTISTRTGSHIDLTAADTENNILFYAGADPSLDPLTYFDSAAFDPNDRWIEVNDNSCRYTGTIYAPYSYVRIDSNNTTINGTVAGDSLAISKDANWVTINYDQAIPPPLAPGMLLIE